MKYDTILLKLMVGANKVISCAKIKLINCLALLMLSIISLNNVNAQTKPYIDPFQLLSINENSTGPLQLQYSDIESDVVSMTINSIYPPIDTIYINNTGSMIMGAAGWNYEAFFPMAPAITVNITVTDALALDSTFDVTISIFDVNESVNAPTTFGQKNFTINDDKPNGASIDPYGVMPYDPEGIVSMAFSPASNEFSIDNAGIITVQNNSAFPAQFSPYVLSVVVYDGALAKETLTVTINITHTPVGTQDPRLAFNPSVFTYTYGDRPFSLNAYSVFGSTGNISYSMVTATNAATVDPVSGLVTITGAGTAVFQANIDGDANFASSFNNYTIVIDKAAPIFTFVNQGNDFAGGPFQLKVGVPPDYDGILSYSLGGVTNAYLTIDQTTGIVTPIAIGGPVTVIVTGSGATNYQDSPSYSADVEIYKDKLYPVAVADTIRVLFGSPSATVNILENDIAYTGILTKNIDIDLNNVGNQYFYSDPSIGQFTVDTLGLLTYIPFKGFIGEGVMNYYVYDSDGLISSLGNVYVIVETPGEEPELVANEVMTPNGDGQNDALVIGYANTSNNNKFWILDETGAEVYYTENYKNDWSGTDKKKNRITSGVYYYIYKEYDSNGGLLRTYSNFCQILN